MASAPLDRYRAPYGPEVQSKLDSFVDGLSTDYALVGNLSPTQSTALANCLLELTCKCQNTRNIQLGRDIFADLPRPWTLKHLESCSAPIASGNDDYEFRRLLELAELIDRDLCIRFADVGAQSSNPEIREASAHFRGDGQTT